MMMYSRFMIVLTLVSMIGLALPSDPQRKIAKGSKKNTSPSSHQEVIPVEVVVPEAMPVEEVKDTVTKVVLNILNDNKRRALTPKPTHPFSVDTADTTETECAPEFTAAEVACYAAKVKIISDGNLADVVISKLKGLLNSGVDQQGIFMTGNKKAYPPVKITNKTPYYADYGVAGYYSWFCRDDVYDVASGQTWTASKRGVCLIGEIRASLALSSNGDHSKCKIYQSPGTTYSQFYIVMYGDDKCCVLSAAEYEKSPKCSPSLWMFDNMFG